MHCIVQGVEMVKQVSGFQGSYRIDNQGNVFSIPKNRFLNIHDNGNGYKTVNLWDSGKKRATKRYIHRLVAQAFLPEWDVSLQVDHINGDKGDNYIRNLRMLSPSQNNRAYCKRRGGSKYRGVHWSKGDSCWYAQIGGKSSKTIHIGSFRYEIQAALAWNEEAKSRGYEKEALNVI